MLQADECHGFFPVKVIFGISFLTASAGEAGIVGESGSGKTTILKLLLDSLTRLANLQRQDLLIGIKAISPTKRSGFLIPL